MINIGQKLDIHEHQKILSRLSSLHPKAIDLSLDRVYSLLNKLKNPHNKIPPVIHIAGTNGKGSTLSFIKAGLEANRKKVHSYTSPHLLRFNERIKIQGKEIDNYSLKNYLSICEKYNFGSEITIFEITTCAAFLAFCNTSADYTLLEVGLGGRLDATNVIEFPKLSVITPISLDHENFLGNTVKKIAFEKAGILKPRTPAIIGKQPKDAIEVISAQAKRLGAPLSIYGEHWMVKKFKDRIIYEDQQGELNLPAPKLVGKHQIENAGIAVTALRKLGIKENSLGKALIEVDWPARLQKIRNGPLKLLAVNQSFSVELWLDGGHNKAAAAIINEFLKNPFDGTSHVICGMIKSKDVPGFISKLGKIPESISCVSIPNEASSLSASEIFFHAKKINYNSYKENGVINAVKGIISRNNSKKNLRIIICGSLYLAGDVLKNHD